MAGLPARNQSHERGTAVDTIGETGERKKYTLTFLSFHPPLLCQSLPLVESRSQLARELGNTEKGNDSEWILEQINQ